MIFAPHHDVGISKWCKTAAGSECLPAPDGGMHYGMPLAMLLVSTLALPFLSKAPDNSGTVAAIFPPWWDSAAIFSASSDAIGPDGSIVGIGSMPFIIILRPRVGQDHASLRKAGAFLILNPEGFKLCARK